MSEPTKKQINAAIEQLRKQVEDVLVEDGRMKFYAKSGELICSMPFDEEQNNE